MQFIVRKMQVCEYPLLDHFLYGAIYVPKGEAPPPREIIRKPELQVYVAGFGLEKLDHALVAEVEKDIVGAVWVRDMRDYGHVADGVPSFAISVDEPYRGKGIGKALMQAMLSRLRGLGGEKASLAVQKANYAVNLYKSVGFEIVDENVQEYIMVCSLNPDRHNGRNI